MVDREAAIADTMRVYDQTAAEFADRTWNLPMEKLRQEFISVAESRKPGVSLRVLDAGCGPGRDLSWFTERGHRVVGGDLSVGMLEEARRRLPECRLLRMDLRFPPFRPGSFDAVWACASLLHVPREAWRDTLLRYRLLLDDGLVFLSVNHGMGERFAAGSTLPEQRRYFTYVSERELLELLTVSGFRVLALRRSAGEPGHDWLRAHAAVR